MEQDMRKPKTLQSKIVLEQNIAILESRLNALQAMRSLLPWEELSIDDDRKLATFFLQERRNN